MLISLTSADQKSRFYMRADMVRIVQRHPKNEMITLVITNVIGPQGPLAYEVLESPDVIAAQINSPGSLPAQTPQGLLHQA